MLSAQRAIRDVVASVTTWPVIHADQNAPRPNVPYITLRLASVTRVGSQEQAQGPVLDKLAVSDVRRGTLMLAAYGAGAQTELTNVSLFLGLSQPKQQLYTQGVTILDHLSINLIPVLRDGTLHEERAVMDSYVSFRLNYEDTVHVIETVEVPNNLGDFSETITINL